MHRHIFPIVVDSEVRWHSVCNVYLFFCGVIKCRRASAGALAPAAGHEPARILNHRRLLAGALAQRLQHVCIIIQYMCVVIQRYRKCPGALAPTTGHAPARIPNHRRSLGGGTAFVTCVYCWRDEGKWRIGAGSATYHGTRSKRHLPLAGASAPQLLDVSSPSTLNTGSITT